MRVCTESWRKLASRTVVGRQRASAGASHETGAAVDTGEAHVMSTRLSSLIAPRYPRRYIGRHRARMNLRFVTRGGLGRSARDTATTVETTAAMEETAV
jgi:hypothetical protein